MSVRKGGVLIAGNPVFRSEVFTVQPQDWDQDTKTTDLTFQGLTASSEILISAAPDNTQNIKDFARFFIYGSGVSTDTVTLTCENIPTVQIKVIVGLLR